MSEQITFLFMDYETFNRNPKGGRASQFASLRTDYYLNIDPASAQNIFCEQNYDNVPSPQAALITKITPQKILKIKTGAIKLPPSSFPFFPVVYNEYWFTYHINNEMSKPFTCTLGYNSFKFDDEFTRNLLYRNLFEPYDREWKNHNSRYDVYYLVIATYVLKPHLLNFPQAVDKVTKEPVFHSKTNLPLPSFRLEELSVANGIHHINAHDAFSDVEATIGIMKKIKDGDALFFEEMFRFRKKNDVEMWLSRNQERPFIHISQFYGKENYCLGALFQIMTINSEVLCLNLAFDVTPLILLEGEDLANYLFPPKGGDVSSPKHTVKFRFNQCPILANINEYWHIFENLEIDTTSFRQNLNLIKDNIGLLKVKLRPLYFKEFATSNPNLDSDLGIYNGFFSNDETNQAKLVHFQIEGNKLADFDYSGFSPRLREMVFKLKARNFPHTLSPAEKKQWLLYSKSRVLDPSIGAELTLNLFYKEVEDIRKSSLSKEDEKVLNEIEDYVSSLKESLSIQDKTVANSLVNSTTEIITDPEIASLQLEIFELENTVNNLANEKAELEKFLSDFQHNHTKHLGDIILELLKLRKDLFKNDKEKLKEAQQDEEDYQEQVNNEKKKVIFEISKEDSKDLKKKYRKASILSHPDKFINESEEVKNLADKIFKDLNEANQQNDLKRVNEILDNLERGILKRSLREKLDDKKILKAIIITLKNKITMLTADVLKIKESDNYITLLEIEDFESYFNNIKEKLQNEILELKKNS
jgi:exodeoxyribonuclease-1